MSVNAVVSSGTQFKRGDGASNETFTALAEINSIGLPGRNRPLIDVTDLDSIARLFKKGLINNGSFVVNMNFTRDAYLDMETDLESDTSVNYQIVFPDAGATTFEFAGLVTDLGGNIPGPDEKITSDVTVQVTGSITISS